MVAVSEWMRRAVACVLLAGLCALAPLAAVAQDQSGSGTALCGTRVLTIARMQWPSSAILAYVHALVLQRALGCNVQVVAGDLAGTASSMATTGEPAIAPEMWVTRITQIWNSASQSRRVRTAGTSFQGGPLETWFVPQHVAERFPDLVKADQLTEIARTVRREDGHKLTFITCPADWACAVINQNMLRALHLTNLVDVVVPANRFELDTLIAQSVSRAQPVVFYYWQPNSVLAQFDFRPLDMGIYNPDRFKCLGRRSCDNPQMSAFVPESVYSVVSDWVMDEAPLVAEYLQRAAMPLSELNELMAWQAENSASYEETAVHFLATRQNLWENWVPAH